MKRMSVVARKAISAETYGEWNRKEKFVPRVIPKTEEQIQRIRAKLQSSFIFNALNLKEIEIVINAMEEKHYPTGEVVINQGDEGNNLFVVDAGTLRCVRKFVLYHS